MSAAASEALDQNDNGLPLSLRLLDGGQEQSDENRNDLSDEREQGVSFDDVNNVRIVPNRTKHDAPSF